MKETIFEQKNIKIKDIVSLQTNNSNSLIKFKVKGNHNKTLIILCKLLCIASDSFDEASFLLSSNSTRFS